MSIDLRTTWRATATNLATSPLSPAVTVIKVSSSSGTKDKDLSDYAITSWSLQPRLHREKELGQSEV